MTHLAPTGRYGHWLIGLLVTGAIAFVLLPWRGNRSIDVYHTYDRSVSNLRNIGFGLRLYHERFGCLPPAVVKDPHGRPLYSWRVALLPFIEYQYIYGEFKLGEPWNSEHNISLLHQMPYTYNAGAGGVPFATHYQVFVGPGTAFERDGLTWADLDGDTLLMVEATQAVPWTKPEDLDVVPDQPLLPVGGVFTTRPRVQRVHHGPVGNFSALFADGTVRYIKGSIDEARLRALIARRHGQKVDLSDVELYVSRAPK